MSGLREILSGTIWVVAARWSMRGIGLISTLVLARLLAPADFGVAAMAMLIVGLIEVFGETGLVLHIIRHPDPPRSHFDTVFTLRLLVGTAMGIVMVLLAPAGAAFFSEPKVTAVVRVLALRPLLMGLENPGIILFRKNMVFSKDFEFLVLNKIVSFIATVCLAFALRNYWALVIGIVVGGLTSTLQSYRMHPFRPRLDISEARAVWRFSFWILIQSMLAFLNMRVDELIIGRVKSTSAMGYYSLANDVGSSPVREIVVPLTRVLFPGAVRLSRDKQALAAAFGKLLAAVAAVSLSVSTGIALVAEDVTAVVLGPRWMELVPLLRILAISAAFLALAQPLYTLLNAQDRPRTVAALTFTRQVLLLAAMVPAAVFAGLQAVAIARTGVAVVTFAMTVAVYARLLEIGAWTIWRSLSRPALAALAMCGAVLLVQAVAPSVPLIRLGLSIPTGMVSYVAALFVLWQAAGRPEGLEGDLLALARRLPRARQRRAI